MTEFWQNFHFLRPWLLLLLLLPAALYVFYFRGLNAQSSWQKVINKRLLDFLLIKGSAVKRRVLVWLGGLGLIAAITAAAGPSWQKIEIPAYAPQNPVMILLNMSTDMAASDLTPSRLARAKYKIKDLLDMLRGVQAGLEVYSSEPFVISPLTDDMNILQNLLPAITPDIMPMNGDRLDRAIELAVEKIKAAGYAKGRLIVFAPDVGQGFDKALAAAEKAAAGGFSLDIIGVSAAASEKLAMVAKAGGGRYWTLQADDAQITALAAEISQTDGNLTQSDNLRTVWLDAGYWLLPLPLLCCLLFFRKGILVVALILCASDAYAGFFLNADQEGLKAFNAGDYPAAAAAFVNSDWKAAALYRAGDYAAAYAEYRQNNSADGLYNQGNALAKGGKIKEAIAKYEEVLQKAPGHEDAKFNLEYLKKQQQQQNQQNQQQQNQNQNNEQNQPQDRQQNQQPDNQDQQQNQNNNRQPSDGGQDSDQRQQNDQASPQSSGRQDKNSDNRDDNADKERESAAEDLLDESNSQPQGNKQGGALPEQGGEDEKYSEEMQAKAARYRDIPEDPGGLLKAFIYEEYRQNRYQDE